MKCRFLLLFLLLLPWLQAEATHLVGGDFELQYRQGNQYSLLLNLYFDDINGRQRQRDESVTAKIYEKGTNREVRSVYMPLQAHTSLNYTNPECVTGSLRTSRLVYQGNLMMEPADFAHPEGYYVVWERCCRNGVINNISDPEGAGQAYYLEFPALMRNGQVFRNSSPVLSPPISDYACLNEEFTYNFGASDPDGDLVTYELATPLNGHAGRGNGGGQANPAPYAEISWLPGYNRYTQIKGDPDLTIDANTGRLSIRPTVKGLFVFSVRYIESRNGVKIGEVRRDFQLLVNECVRNEPPKITAKAPGSTSLYQEGEIVRVSTTSSRCITLYLTDSDPNERLALSATPVNFSRRGYVLSGQTTGNINRSGQKDTLVATLCLDKCFDTNGGIYYLDVIVSDFGDNGCGLPKRDTVRVSILAEPVPDLPPAIAFSVPQRLFEVYDGDVLSFDVTGNDPDNDPVQLSVRGQNFAVADQSIQFAGTRANGQVTTPFRWQIDCKATAVPVYLLEFTVTSYICGIELRKTELVEVRVLKRTLLNNTITAGQVICSGDTPVPLLGSQPTGGNGSFRYVWEVSTTDDQTGFTATAGRSRDFAPQALTQTCWFRRVVISGSCDEIQDISLPVQVLVNTLPERPAGVHATVCPGFPATLEAAAANPGLTFQWYDLPAGGNLLHTGPAYTTPPIIENTTFYVQVTNGNGCVSDGRTAVQAQVLPPTADAGPDEVMIKGQYVTLKGKGGLKYRWLPEEGLSNATIPNPVAKPGQTTHYVLSVTTDKGCIYTDTMTVTVLEPISPKNAITINGDGKNDIWYIENIELYPRAGIQVFTRWGAKVFESTGYTRPWSGTDEDGKELPMGAYYYIIKLEYLEKPITGSITLIR